MNKKWIFLGCLACIVTGVALTVATSWGLKKTSETAFCLSCHTMQAPYEEYQGSVHFMNQKGIRAECKDCHVPESGSDYLLTKLRASKDVYHQFISKKIDTPEQYEVHRLEMAQTVWSQMKANDSATCRSCHSMAAMDLQKQSSDAQKMHALAKKENQTCIDCHKGVAHFPPEITIDSKALDDLMNEAEKTQADAKERFAVTLMPLGDLGNVYPATRMKVLRQTDTGQEVEISGSQTQNAQQVIYLATGQRMVIASLTPQGQQALKPLSDWQKDSYGNSWRNVSLQGPVTTPSLGSQEPLWRYAKSLDTAYCSGCHAPIAADHYTLNAWPSIAKGMGARTDIRDDDLDILTRWFQYHAKDIAR
ncbi:NapC/NirT family cytochrome c [Buttiauxella sp.]|uniref:NapC/NirT family cytochrome c n=1 Tax=Buttiauxella sp. TaxID=1972222 RepID=UPI003C720BCA